MNPPLPDPTAEDFLPALEMRVLGSLMEKAVLTPEVYPLSLNALVTACNQKTSREPVTEYDEPAVQQALDRLREKRLVLRVDMAGSRVARYRERVGEAWELSRAEHALLTLLLLRGAQTAGQLRARADRLADFADVEAVEAALQGMLDRPAEPHVLVRSQRGIREVRWATRWHPAGSPVADESPSPPPGSRGQGLAAGTALEERVAHLEGEVARLTAELQELRRLLE